MFDLNPLLSLNFTKLAIMRLDYKKVKMKTYWLALLQTFIIRIIIKLFCYWYVEDINSGFTCYIVEWNRFEPSNLVVSVIIICHTRRVYYKNNKTVLVPCIKYKSLDSKRLSTFTDIKQKLGQVIIIYINNRHSNGI